MSQNSVYGKEDLYQENIYSKPFESCLRSREETPKLNAVRDELHIAFVGDSLLKLMTFLIQCALEN